MTTNVVKEDEERCRNLEKPKTAHNI